MDLDSVIIPSAIAGVFGVGVAVLTVTLPNRGRIRRVERIVDILTKVEDESGRLRLLAIRDRFIGSLELDRSRETFRYFIGLGVASAGYIVAFVGFFLLDRVNDLVAWGVVVVGVIVFIVGLIALLVAYGRIRHMTRARKRAAAESAAAEAEQIERLEPAAAPGKRRQRRKVR